jgi:UDP-glucose 4-epimerase
MKICVTGGAGFIGSHVAAAYLAAGAEVVAVDDLSTGSRRNVPAGVRLVVLDIRHRRAVRELFEAEEFEVVNHHAAQISVPQAVRDPVFDAEVNVMGLLNVLEASAATGVGKVIFISSGGTVYGNPDALPCRETYPFDPASPYGITKTAGEFYVRFFAREHGLAWTALRYSNVYGPRQDPHGEAGVVAIFAQRLLAGEPVALYALAEIGDGGCWRDYVYAEDVAAANVAALDRGAGEAFNIGTGIQTQTRTVLDLLVEVSGRRVSCEDRPPRPGDLARNAVDPDKARRVLGWEPRVELGEGLRRTFEYFASERNAGKE